MHNDDEAFKDDVFIVNENEEFTEQSMNPAVQGQDLRFAFDRPEYRVMLVADKFQTGFDQPRLVAMYVDKKIANHVEIVQTFTRLNRMAPGKDEVFIIDFVNDPANVRQAFSLYDDGAHIDDVWRRCYKLMYNFGMTYPLKFRQHVLAIKEKEKLTYAETATRFCVGTASLMRWARRIDPCQTRDKPATKINRAALILDVETYPDA